MRAIRLVFLADLRRRRLQTLVIAVVMLLTSGAATLALSLLVESDAPYAHAFSASNGAHLTIVYDATKVSAARLRASASAPPVAQSSGPWPEIVALYSLDSAGFSPAGGLLIVGRSTPNSSVDRLIMEAGRWASAPGEVVVSQALADRWRVVLGDTLSPGGGFEGPRMTVVGIAASISPFADAWMPPGRVRAMAGPRAILQYQVAYRVRDPGTDGTLRAATQRITKGLPPAAVVSVGSYLEVQRGADLLSAVMVPFLLAFSAFALVASLFIITNVVGGAVVAGYRRIGIMKSLGFTPGGVVLVLLGQVLAPAAVGSIAGVGLGTLAAQPFLRDTAHALGLPAPFTAVAPVVLFVLLLAMASTALAALFPALRAGRLSAVDAISRGTAPTRSRGSRLEESLRGLPLPRPFALGLADGLSRPARSLMTVGAVLSGVATVIFGLSLHLSLGQVAQHLIRSNYVQIRVSEAQADGSTSIQKGGTDVTMPKPPPPAVVERSIRRDPGVARYVAQGEAGVTVSGIAQPVPFIAYRGRSDWQGFALIAGRWFTQPGEVVVPTRVLTDAHLRVGDSLSIRKQGRVTRVTIVGEILDQSYDNLLLRGAWSTLRRLDPGLRVDEYEVATRYGVDPVIVARRLSGPAVSADPTQRDGDSTSFLLLNTVIAGLALVLLLIAVAGVFNTVVLNTRERAREIAILKAIGMTPRQVVAMVVASVALLGLVAGVGGIPAGVLLHHQILQVMGDVASGTSIPPSFLDAIAGLVLVAMALVGVLIAVLGAVLPALWAARGGVAEVLQAE